ncbi:MAG: IS1595 family transposase [Actinomycetota bacterium]
MPKVDRNNPKRGSVSESRYSLMEFEREFPDDAACLDWLVTHRYPDGVFCRTCDRITKHHRDANRPSYACQFCGTHMHPMKGTMFENSATSLKLWFYAIYLMTSTRCGVSAKHLERELGVTYKTAWRMANRIRELLAQDRDLFDGTVEVDEAYFGGKDMWRHKNKRRRDHSAKDKTPVVGLAQRGREGQPGKVLAKVVEGTTRYHLRPIPAHSILPGSTVYSDQHLAYHTLGKLGYERGTVNHHLGVYVDGDVHTNTIEGFWANVKRGVSGNYHAVSEKFLQNYLDEFVFRYNNRSTATPKGVFGVALSRIPRA